MAAFNKFDPFVEALGRKVHNLHTDTLKIFLTNEAPLAADSVKADMVEIVAGNGYTAGGHQLPLNSFAHVAGLAKLAGGNVIITAAGGPIGPFRYAVLYNDTALNDELIGYWDYGSSISLLDGEAITIKVNAANGILQIQ